MGCKGNRKENKEYIEHRGNEDKFKIYRNQDEGGKGILQKQVIQWGKREYWKTRETRGNEDKDLKKVVRCMVLNAHV